MKAFIVAASRLWVSVANSRWQPSAAESAFKKFTILVWASCLCQHRTLNYVHIYIYIYVYCCAVLRGSYCANFCVIAVCQWLIKKMLLLLLLKCCVYCRMVQHFTSTLSACPEHSHCVCILVIHWVKSTLGLSLKAKLNQIVLTWEFPVLNVYLLVKAFSLSL